jgi:hypothetical protein
MHSDQLVGRAEGVPIRLEAIARLLDSQWRIPASALGSVRMLS